MLSKCAACDKNINRNHPGIQCRGFCSNSFHTNKICSELSKDQAEVFKTAIGATWICEICRSSERNLNDDIGGGRSNARRSSMYGISRADNIDSSDIHEELRIIRESVTFCSNKVSDFEATLKKLADYMKLTDKLKEENEHLKSELNAISVKMSLAEQSSRSNNIEITGVPERKNEDLVKVVQNIGCFIDYKIEDSMVDYVHRVPTRNAEGQPKNIILRLMSKRYRDNMIAAAKAKVRESPKKRLILDGASSPIYLNEHLTQTNKAIFKEARAFAKQKQLKFVWVRNGNVFLRKDDRSKVIHVKNIAALDSI